jgi:telomerase Cajal body protein 1
VHLFDAYSGAIRATYSPFNALDEMESPTVVSFSPDGQKIVSSGFRTNRTIHVFDTARPGRESTLLRLGKTRRSSDGQKGLVSAMSFANDGKIFAVGTYSPGSIYIYDDRTGQQPNGTILSGLCVVGHGRSHSRKKRRLAVVDGDDDENWLASAKLEWFQTRAQGGVTQLMFAPDQNYILYSASRRSDAIISWDLRMLSGDPDYQSTPVRGLGSYVTDNNTNQRLKFEIDETGQTLLVGGRDKCVRVYAVSSGEWKGQIDGLDDAANGVSYSKTSSNRVLLAVATGSRHFPSEDAFDLDAVPQSCDEMPGYLRLYELT